MTTLIATSVVRGSRQGESHGGVYLVDLDRERARQVIDWNTRAIDWQGRGWDRGLRGIAFDDGRVFVAASDELFVYNTRFEQLASYRCVYLKHCHETSIRGRTLYITSTGFDSILGFDLDEKTFNWAMHVDLQRFRFTARAYDPQGEDGPLHLAGNKSLISVNLSMDVRNAIHGLEVWPYE